MPNRTEEDYLDLMRRVQFKKLSFYCGCILVALCIIGFFGNSLSIYVFSRKNMRKKSINILLIGLSASDLSLLILALPIFALQPLAAPKIDDFNRIIIAYVYPLATIFQTCSVWIFILITIERYIAVCHPFKALTYFSTQWAVWSIFATFALSCAYNFVRFWEYNLFHCSDNQTSACLITMSAFVTVENLRANPVYQFWYSTIGYFLTQYFLPCLIMAIFNGLIIRTIVKARKTRAALTTVQQTEQTTSVMMGVVVLIFVLCYSLSFVLNLYEALHPMAFYDQIYGAVLFFVNDLSNTLVVANSATTFIVYLILSNRYRWISGNCLFFWKTDLETDRKISNTRSIRADPASAMLIISGNSGSNGQSENFRHKLSLNASSRASLGIELKVGKKLVRSASFNKNHSSCKTKAASTSMARKYSSAATSPALLSPIELIEQTGRKSHEPCRSLQSPTGCIPKGISKWRHRLRHAHREDTALLPRDGSSLQTNSSVVTGETTL